MDDEPVFGQLTARQVILGGGSLVIMYYAFVWLDTKFSIPIVIVVLGLVIAWWINHPRIVIDEAYLTKKRYHAKNLEEYKAWLKRKILFISAQIEFRQAQKQPDSKELERKLKLFTDAMRDSK